VINGISRLSPLITTVITHLLSRMNHQVDSDRLIYPPIVKVAGRAIPELNDMSINWALQSNNHRTKCGFPLGHVSLPGRLLSWQVLSFITTGWWFHTLWKILVKWDDDIPNIWKNNPNVPYHQSDDDVSIVSGVYKPWWFFHRWPIERQGEAAIGLLDWLLGVAGMITNVMDWIIPENSLRAKHR